MPSVRPILDEFELQQVQHITIDGDQVLVEHAVPGLEGDFLQRLNRRADQIQLSGILTGADSKDNLKTLRDKFRAGTPVSFVTDITTATHVNEVLIVEMGVRELAGKLERFEYAFLLREYIKPPPTTTEPPPPIPPPPPPDDNINQQVGTLVVEVIVEGQSDFDFSSVTVNVTGAKQDGSVLSQTLTNRTDNVWTETNFPAGSYNVEATATASPTLTGTAPAVVQAGQTTNVQITLRRNNMVATTFVVHFRFDKAFIEPCMRYVLEDVFAYSNDHPDEKLVIVGHTDLVGSDAYNQSLSERRSRSSYSYLTYGGDRSAALAEWNLLRRRRATGTTRAIEDTWDVFQYQFILQELRYYPGNVDGVRGPLTDDAVEAYRCHKGFPPGTNVDDPVWEALIQDYLDQRTALNIPDSRLLPNSGPGGCDAGRLKWLGCGEKDPVDNTQLPRRQNRRTEFIFLKANQLNCEIPRPDTLDLPPPQPPGTQRPWCLDQGNAKASCCFLTPAKESQCPQDTQQRWCRKPLDDTRITLQGRIRFQGFQPNTAVRFKYIITAPNGEYIDGEVVSGSHKGEGNGKIASGRTDGSGNFDETFSYSGKPKGYYTLEVTGPYSTSIRGPFLLRLEEQQYSDTKGNSVCKKIQSDSDRLNVIVLPVPALREMVLPVVVHLMTALHPTTREVRTCPDAINPTVQHRQQTTRTRAVVNDLFDEANRIWRQARIKFDVVDIVNVAYSDSTHPQCGVGSQELTSIITQCAYPNVTNVFFFGVLEASGEGGVHQKIQYLGTGGTVLQTFEGIAIGDMVLMQLFSNTAPIATTPSRDDSIIILSHELGHQLELDHPDSGSPNPGRLMDETLAIGNETLIVDEVNTARASTNAQQECMPLSLRVTGATRIGGSHSHKYLVIQDAAVTVSIDTQISARLIDPAVGSVTITGGNPGATPMQRTVSAGTTGTNEVEAIYTPVGGGRIVKTRAVIRVATFELTVIGASRVTPGGNDYIAISHMSDVVTVTAVLQPSLFCVPNDMITWNGGTAVADPMRVTVARSTAGLTAVSANVAGVTRTVNITVVSVTLPSLTLLGLNHTLAVPVTVNPTTLPTGTAIRLRLPTVSGTGSAVFVSNNLNARTITTTTTVSIRGVTVSSVADNIRLTAMIDGTPDIIAQEDFTIVQVTISSVVGVKVGQSVNITVTVAPTLPASSQLIELELSTTSGNGQARFNSGNPTTMRINQTTTVSVIGVTASSQTDNIRLTAKVVGQMQFLAQEDFTVLNPINIFLKFEIWDINTHAFVELPAGINVELMDEDFISDTVMATQQTDSTGQVLFSLADFSASGEDEPDLYFKVRGGGVFHGGHILPDEWSTKGWKATDGSPGYYDNFTGTQLGTEAAPLTFRVGLDVHARVNYYVAGGGRVGNTDPAPVGVDVSIYSGSTRKRTFSTDANGEIHGVVFNVEGGDDITLRIDFQIQDLSINLKRASVDIDEWGMDFNDNNQTSLGTFAAPLLFHANSDDRNVALYFLKVLRELSTFLFHITGGSWQGFDDLTYYRTSASGVAYSWPVGSVNLPPSEHWNRGTIVHETSHQIMWQEHGRSSADIAFEALFGQLSMYHREDLLTNTEHALIEGWAEFPQAIFAGTMAPPYIVTPVVDKDGNSLGPLGPPPLNRGESVEGAFANGMWNIFQDHVVTNTVYSAAGATNAHVPETNSGDITTTASWITNADVRTRFVSMVWQPFRDLRTVSGDPTTSKMFERMQIRNPSTWHLLQGELQAFNMAMTSVTVTSISPTSGPVAGGQTVTISGTNFVPGMQVRFAQAPPGGGLATNVVVVNTSTLTATTPAGVVGTANILLTTSAGADTLVGAYSYV